MQSATQDNATMTNQWFESTRGMTAPWHVQGVAFDAAQRQITIAMDFVAGTRFAYDEVAGEHPVHDTQSKRLRHLNFFQHECFLDVRARRVRMPDGAEGLVEADWVGQLNGFALLFDTLVLILAQQIPFAAVARVVNLSWHRVHAICSRYVELALAAVDLSDVTAAAIDDTSYRRGHEYLTLVVDMLARRVVFLTTGEDAGTSERFAACLGERGGTHRRIGSVSIDVSPGFIKGVDEHAPDGRVTFDKFHVVAQASKAFDTVRWQQQKVSPQLKGIRWTFLKDANKLNLSQLTDLDALVSQYTTRHTALVWLAPQAPARHSQAQANQCCVDDDAAGVHHRHTFKCRTDEGRGEIGSPAFRWHRCLDSEAQTDGFMQAINGLFQATKRKARGYARFETMCKVLFLVAGKLDSSR